MFNIFKKDIGIDLGTSNTLIYVKNHGIVLREPSVVAVQSGTPNILAVGDEARQMIGRTPPNITTIQPLKNGVIADLNIVEAMLEKFISKLQLSKWSRPNIVVAVPSNISEVERKAVEESLNKKSKKVYLISEAMAAAMGCGLPVQDSVGNFIVCIGGGTTEIAVISLSGIVLSESIFAAGNKFDNAIIDYIRGKYNLIIGERMAEEIKIKVGSVFSLEEELTCEVKGRNLIGGLPNVIKVSSEEIRDILLKEIKVIVDTVKKVLEECPPELSSDLIERGIMICGGGSLLRGFDKLLEKETNLPIYMAEDPLGSVCAGTGIALDELKFLKNIDKSK